MKPSSLLQDYLKPEEVYCVRETIDRCQNFVISTHVHPDGDALGSELSLYFYLTELGKNVTILNHSPIPDLYRFLDPGGLIRKYNPVEHKNLLQSVDVCFALDIGDWDRLDDVGQYIEELRKKHGGRPDIICIDHHPHEQKIGDFDITYSEASSTGEIIFLLLKSLGGNFTESSALALYTAVLTDTGSFRFSNTTVNSHIIAAYLIKLGINHRQVYQQVYENEPLTKMKLLAELLQNLNFECNGHVLWFRITRNMLDKYNLNPEEIEGISEFPRRIQGVQISILFMEIEGDRTKVSFRSAGNVAINGFAQKFGGGGHPYASGALVEMPIDRTIQDIIGKVCRFYRDNR